MFYLQYAQAFWKVFEGSRKHIGKYSRIVY